VIGECKDNLLRILCVSSVVIVFGVRKAAGQPMIFVTTRQSGAPAMGTMEGVLVPHVGEGYREVEVSSTQRGIMLAVI
jgi:hypothetical protein